LLISFLYYTLSHIDRNWVLDLLVLSCAYIVSMCFFVIIFIIVIRLPASSYTRFFRSGYLS
jgi:hypothetical protein